MVMTQDSQGDYVEKLGSVQNEWLEGPTYLDMLNRSQITWKSMFATSEWRQMVAIFNFKMA